jgi:hypothetical protein
MLALLPFHQEMGIRGPSIEFEKLESAESVHSAETAATTSHKDWLDIESVDTSVPKRLSNLFPLGRAQKEKLENERARKSYEYDRKGEQGNVTTRST